MGGAGPGPGAGAGAGGGSQRQQTSGVLRQKTIELSSCLNFASNFHLSRREIDVVLDKETASRKAS